MIVLVLTLGLAPGAGAEALSSPFDAERALETCRDKLGVDAARAARCYDDIATNADAPPEQAAVAAELAEVARALLGTAVKDAPEGAEGAAVSVSALVESGAPELVLSSAAYGGVAGFLTAATALSATRINQLDSLPWLIGTPALGILLGGAGAAAAAYSLELDAGDAALLSSAPWVGTGWGIALQLALFDQRDDVGHIPLRFSTVLGTGLGLGAVGAFFAWGLDVDAGDVGLMNSAALWGAVLSGLAYISAGSAGLIRLEPDHPMARPSGVFSVVLAASVLPWSAALALHPFVEVPRPATWLIEGGGLAGLLSGFAFVALASSRLPSAAIPGVLTVTTAVGVVSGAALTFTLSDVVAELELAAFTGKLFSVAPTLLPPAPGHVEVAPGLVATLQF